MFHRRRHSGTPMAPEDRRREQALQRSGEQKRSPVSSGSSAANAAYPRGKRAINLRHVHQAISQAPNRLPFCVRRKWPNLLWSLSGNATCSQPMLLLIREAGLSLEAIRARRRFKIAVDVTEPSGCQKKAQSSRSLSGNATCSQPMLLLTEKPGSALYRSHSAISQVRCHKEAQRSLVS